MAWRAVVGLAFALASAGLFLYAGRFHSRRTTSQPASLAQRAFVIWWYGLGAITLGGAAFSTLASVGVVDLALWEVWTFASLAILCLALWGLVYYLVYLFTGNTIWAPILGVAYVLYFFVLIYFVQLSNPIGVEVTPWRAQIDYEFEVRDALYKVVIGFLLLPQILAGLAYFSLFFRVHDRAQRYRIALVSWAIIVWFAAPFLALDPAVSQTDAWQIFSKLLGLSAALATLFAYRPPSFVQRWIGKGRKMEKTMHAVPKPRAQPLRPQHAVSRLARLFKPTAS